MVGLRKVEDRPTPACVYNHRVYLCSLIAAFAAIMIGYDSAFIGGTIALSSFKNEFGLTTKTTAQNNLISANIVSTYQAGWYVSHIVWFLLYFLKREKLCSFFGALFGYPAGNSVFRYTYQVIVDADNRLLSWSQAWPSSSFSCFHCWIRHDARCKCLKRTHSHLCGSRHCWIRLVSVCCMHLRLGPLTISMLGTGIGAASNMTPM